MSLSDPQSIKIGESTIEAPRVSVGDLSSEYLSADGNTKVTVSSVSKKRNRHTFRVDVQKISEDPFVDGQSQQVGLSAYLVVDRPIVGYDTTEAYEVVKGLVEVLSASSYAATKKLLGFES